MDIHKQYRVCFVAFLVDTRTRSREGARAVGRVTGGFLETATASSKTATNKRRRLPLPLVALARGVPHGPRRGRTHPPMCVCVCVQAWTTQAR